MLHKCQWIACGLFITCFATISARAQVWIDASQLGDRVPDWVDAKLYHPTPVVIPPPCTTRVWVEAVYRTVRKQVWCEAVVQTICEQKWVDGHYEMHSVTTIDEPCGCPTTHTERVWVPGHYVTTQRQVCIKPGHWETIETRECVSPGHWENVVLLRD